MDYKKIILITGGAGFIGSHVVRKMINQYPEYLIVNLDKLIQINPTYGRAYQEIGHTNILLKEKNKALKAYLRAVRHNPSLQSSWLGILALENKNEELIKFDALYPNFFAASRTRNLVLLEILAPFVKHLETAD